MNLDQVQKLIVVITSVTGFLSAVWKLFKKQETLYEEYTRKYYLEVLEPVINEVVLNKKTLENALMKQAEQKYSYIPTYISYMIHLINRGSTRYSWDDIKEVITVDYLFNRPGLSNSRLKSLNRMGNTFQYVTNIVVTIIGIIVFPLGITLEVAILVSTFFEMISKGQLVVPTVSICIALIALSMIISGLILIKKIDIGGDELYPKSIEKMEKIISNKCENYTTFVNEYKAKNPNISEEHDDMLYLCINRVIRNECSDT